jgi:hypothetical protein
VPPIAPVFYLGKKGLAPLIRVYGINVIYKCFGDHHERDRARCAGVACTLQVVTFGCWRGTRSEKKQKRDKDLT